MPEQPVSEPSAVEQAPVDAAVPDAAVPDAAPVEAEADSGKFTVRLTNFTGPFDLLLQLIGKHKLDVTEIALHQVTDDFIAYIRGMGDAWDLGETSEFLLVAATLLDLKAARLLPSAEVEDEEDLALLEARDLLFARLLQYKAYKEAAAVIADLEATGARRWPRAVTLEPRYAEALPDLVLGIGPERLLKLALKQFLPKPGPPEVSIAHIHQVRVSVREHAALIRERLRRAGSATFSLLIADCETTLEVVARFLALLELYREGLVDFEQPVSLEEMTVRWIGGDQVEGDLDIDDYEGTPPEPDTAAMDLDAEGVSADDLAAEPGDLVAEPGDLAIDDYEGFPPEPDTVAMDVDAEAASADDVAAEPGDVAVEPGDLATEPEEDLPDSARHFGADVIEPDGAGPGSETDESGAVASGAEIQGSSRPRDAVLADPATAEIDHGGSLPHDAVSVEPGSAEYDDGDQGIEVTVLDGTERESEPAAASAGPDGAASGRHRADAAPTVSTDEEVS